MDKLKGQFMLKSKIDTDCFGVSCLVWEVCLVTMCHYLVLALGFCPSFMSGCKKELQMQNAKLTYAEKHNTTRTNRKKQAKTTVDCDLD